MYHCPFNRGHQQFHHNNDRIYGPQIENSEGGYQFKGGSRLKILVYADDICLIGQEKEDIQRSLDLLTKFTDWAGLTIKISKCGSLTNKQQG